MGKQTGNSEYKEIEQNFANKLLDALDETYKTYKEYDYARRTAGEDSSASKREFTANIEWLLFLGYDKFEKREDVTLDENIKSKINKSDRTVSQMSLEEKRELLMKFRTLFEKIGYTDVEDKEYKKEEI